VLLPSFGSELRAAIKQRERVMKSLLGRVLGAVVLVSLTIPARGIPAVYYEGREAGGPSEMRYAYRVDAEEEDYGITEFRVVTGDLNLENYTDVVKPEGWEFGIGDDVNLGCYGGYTEVGGFAILLKHVTTQSVVWWTKDPKSAITKPFTFGFNHSAEPGDAAWYMVSQKPDTFCEASAAPVGMGCGPVHGPGTTGIPEPATVLLLSLGSVVLRRK